MRVVEPTEHLCNGTGRWELGVFCDKCVRAVVKRTRLPAPMFNIAHLRLWNNMEGAGGMTDKEYHDKVMSDARASGKTEEQMPVSKHRWI